MNRPYNRTTVNWQNRDERNAYMRKYQAEWRKRNPEKYRAAVARWRLNGKLRDCGLVDVGVRGGRG